MVAVCRPTQLFLTRCHIFSQAGVAGLALSAAATYAKFGIRVNVVSPGLTGSPACRALFPAYACTRVANTVPSVNTFERERNSKAASRWRRVESRIGRERGGGQRLAARVSAEGAATAARPCLRRSARPYLRRSKDLNHKNYQRCAKCCIIS